MGQTAVEETQRQLDELVRARFPGDAVKRVTLLQHGDDPMVEPGELVARVLLQVADGPEGEQRSLEEFKQTHGAAMKHFRHDLEERLPEVRRVVITTEDTAEKPGQGRMFIRLDARPERDRGTGDLTPVMARLGPVDLETLDALITAGIAPNRAEAVRWALARIRERPAYAQLRDRVREIEELKAQF
jgi:hypothetical protein